MAKFTFILQTLTDKHRITFCSPKEKRLTLVARNKVIRNTLRRGEKSTTVGSARFVEHYPPINQPPR